MRSGSAEQQFILFFNEYRLAIHAYIYRFTADAYAAEELTQELFIKLWEKREQFHEIENIDRYLFRMAHNASINWLKKLALDTEKIKEFRKRFAGNDNNIDNHINLVEAQKLLAKAVASLSPQRRKVFELSRNQGLKSQEIAEQLGLSVNTVNHHLVSALAQLRKYFMQHLDSENIALLLFLLSLIEK